MTQMGLDYAKFMESKRHNLATEQDADADRSIKQQEADAKTYVASFEDRKTTAAEKQAAASASQAFTASRKQDLADKYAEREIAVKETQAEAATKQAEIAELKFALSELQTLLDNVTDVTAANVAMRELGKKYDIPETVATPTSESVNTVGLTVFDFLGKLLGKMVRK